MMLKKIDTQSDCIVLQLRSDLIMENTREFFDAFLEFIDGGPSEVLLDFSKIRFIDSSGIGILLKCTDSAKTKESKLLIYGLNRQMTSVFKLAGLMKIFEVLEDAVVKGRFPELFTPES